MYASNHQNWIMEEKLQFKYDETYTYKFVYPNIKERNQRL